MSDDVYKGVDAEFVVKYKQALDTSKAAGYEFHPYSGVRTPKQQAATWMQGRTTAQRDAKVAEFLKMGATYLAGVLKAQPPVKGAIVSNAPPGYSWHNYGEALDAYWLKAGKAEWNDLSGYRFFAGVVAKFGLTAGASFGDYPHVQKRAASGPHKRMIGNRLITLKEMDDELRKMYGG